MKGLAHRGDNLYVTIFERCLRSQPQTVFDLLAKFNLRLESTKNYPWIEFVDTRR